MAKFHINADGNVGRCSAKEGKCSFGVDAPHFGTEAEARTHYEQVQGSSVSALKKEIQFKPWRVMKDVQELKDSEFLYSTEKQRDNFKLMLARIEHAQDSINTPCT